MHLYEIVPFLQRAKRSTYAAGIESTQSSRPGSHDLPYQEGEYLYIDTYLGGHRFIGEEAVWREGKPLWGMNYYGWMLVDIIPEGFSPFLKDALFQVPQDAPYRGPADFASGRFSYSCRWEGNLDSFTGNEWIEFDRVKIYALNFHGGAIV